MVFLCYSHTRTESKSFYLSSERPFTKGKGGKTTQGVSGAKGAESAHVEGLPVKVKGHFALSESGNWQTLPPQLSLGWEGLVR